MDNVKFEVACEVLDDNLIGSLQELLPQHYHEVARKDLFAKLNPDWDFYKTAQANGILKVFTARLPENYQLVGYWFFYVRNHPHYKDVVSAADDIIFVHKDHRGKPVHVFMADCLEKLKCFGVQTVVIHCKVAYDLEPLYRSLGFEPFEKNFIRSL